ncbi:MAG TPA: D-aminoacyl-tRNA deacylase [Vicinamibacterales bacterium]
MRAVIQRVSSASVTADDHSTAIKKGLLVLLGVEREDALEDVQYIARKIRELRVFDEADKGFNQSVLEAGGEVMVVSQFTLAADCRKGRRPSFDDAAPPEIAEPLYERVVRELETAGLHVATGRFRAMMQVALVNDGPVTLLLDSRKRF